MTLRNYLGRSALWTKNFSLFYTLFIRSFIRRGWVCIAPLKNMNEKFILQEFVVEL